MASAPSEQSSVLQDELTCPVCLDLYRDPHLLPCGHNFCKICLDRLKRQADRGRFRCPECRDSHRCGTNFQKNFKLSNIADDYRRRRRATAAASKSKEPVPCPLSVPQARRPFAVPCDYCPSVAAEASGISVVADGSSAASVSQEGGDEREAAAVSVFAVKTCLKCEVSMCQEHVRPHLELPAFREHPLTEPRNDLWKMKCPDHDEIYRWDALARVYCCIHIFLKICVFHLGSVIIRLCLMFSRVPPSPLLKLLLLHTFNNLYNAKQDTFLHNPNILVVLFPSFLKCLFVQDCISRKSFVHLNPNFICYASSDITVWMTGCACATLAI